jgi:hypothetical protein
MLPAQQPTNQRAREVAAIVLRGFIEIARWSIIRVRVIFTRDILLCEARWRLNPNRLLNERELKRPLLYLLIGSVLLGAVIGIVLVLRNTWSWLEVRVMLTTIVVAGASLLGLACDLARTPRGRNVFPRTGLALTFAASSFLLLGIWLDNSSEVFWKTTICLSVLAMAAVHVCLLSIAKLAPRFRWVSWVACQVIIGLALLICATLIWEIDDAGLYRFLAALSIVVAALTLVIPLLHRISRGELKSTDLQSGELATPLQERNLAAIDDEIVRLRKRIAELEQLRSEVASV